MKPPVTSRGSLLFCVVRFWLCQVELLDQDEYVLQFPDETASAVFGREYPRLTAAPWVALPRY